MTIPDDCALLQRVAQDDQAAFQELYAAYYTRLWRYVWYQLDGNAHWVEEVLQNIFMAIWRSSGSFRGNAKVATWIFQIAHNLVLNARRDHSRRTEGHLTFASEQLDEEPEERDWQENPSRRPV